MFSSREVMTSWFTPIIIGNTDNSIHKDANHNIRHRDYRNVLRSKENTYKHKCKKVLKRKLKKYKLRQDGEEDQDIIDVSDTLVTSLFIRSPIKSENSVELDLEGIRPKNYLFKMVRRKHTSKTTSTDTKSFEEKEVLHISPATEEKKKQTNAFKLLMESRNKSLGSNSPGKEKPVDETESQEFMEKKNIKAKRSLILQKMAEDKGSLKKKEVEEQHEKYLKKKMEKRAEKLKSMIMNKEPKTVNDTQKNSLTQKVRSPLDSIDTVKNKKVVDKSIKRLQHVSIFGENINGKISPEKRIIPKEDEEFLKKLSPSIRKKESMLSYFKKVQKESNSPVTDSENDNVVIKVKLGSKSKKRGRKKKLSLIKDTERSCDVSANKIDSTDTIELDLDVEIIETSKQEKNEIHLIENSDKIGSESSKKRRKRKREVKESSPCSDIPLISYSSNQTDDNKQLRRSVKRLTKYNDFAVTSSDEELLIFTPKKKKHVDQKKLIPKTPVNQDTKMCDSEKSKQAKSTVDKCKKMVTKPKKPKEKNTTNPVKLAPIFTKSQPDLAAIEAKQKFLQSGVPEQLKKLKSKQKDCNTVSNSFPIVVHVQQLDTAFPEFPKLNLHKIGTEEVSFAKSDDAFTRVLNLSTIQTETIVLIKDNVNIHDILKDLKTSYPKFPVNRTYKLLRDKKKGEFRDNNIYSNLDNSVEILNCSIDMQNNNPDQLTWSDKYKPLSGKEIIGNFESVKELKKWLVTWTENETRSKVNNLNNSDSSDYYQSDPDSSDSIKSNNNLLILSGPVGCGKTLSVYAVAAELSIKVIEVNASSKRTGKIMLQDLQEATQSHKVNRKAGSAENSQKSQENSEPLPEGKVKKRGRPKKVVEPPTPKKVIPKEKPDVPSSASQESTRTVMSLILIDDADIVFDQDDGFYSAIMQLVQCSKRPVILITGSLSLPHLQKFMLCSKILKMQPLVPNLLGTWLDLICLADSGTCSPGDGAKFLNYFKGDMRKTINCLQFYLGSQDQAFNVEGNTPNSQYSDVVKFNVDDENSCMSWTDREVFDDRNINDASSSNSQSLWDTYVNEFTYLRDMKYPLRIFDVWWSVPRLLNLESSANHEMPNNVEKKNSQTSLESMSSVLDCISVCDYFSQIRPDTEANMTSHPWYDSECNSVSELENLDYYDRKYEASNEISYELVKGSILCSQKNIGLENRFDLNFPGLSAKRQRDKTVSRLNKLTSYLSPQSSLDRKALALDYWSSCRSICRIEKSKTDSTSKRNNRFCHYLKSLSVLCSSETFDSLANSLNPSGDS